MVDGTKTAARTETAENPQRVTDYHGRTEKAENRQKRTADGQAVTRSSRRTDGQKPPEQMKGRNAHNGEDRTQDGETHAGRQKKRIQRNCTKAKDNSSAAKKPRMDAKRQAGKVDR